LRRQQPWNRWKMRWRSSTEMRGPMALMHGWCYLPDMILTVT
jgi:hypothetical protein